MNNIEALERSIKERAAIDRESAMEEPELTEEERNRLSLAAPNAPVTVVTETAEDGSTASVPIEEYAKPLDKRIRKLPPTAGQNAERILKAINTGAYRKSVEDAKGALEEQAIALFREKAGKNESVESEEILRINREALDAAMKFLGVEKPDSDIITKRLAKMTMTNLVRVLPKEFTNAYLTPEEIRGNDEDARARAIAVLAFTAAAGPGMEDLNEYIQEEERLMTVSKRILQVKMDFTEMLKSEEKVSEFVKRAAALLPEGDGWSANIHGVFAQYAVVYEEYEAAYRNLLEEYRGDKQAEALILEEIEECVAKRKIYMDVTNLTLFQELWKTLTERYRGDRRKSRKFLEDEAKSALERIRRSKVNVPFPWYDPKLAKRPAELYQRYMAAFCEFLDGYNAKTREGVETARSDPEKYAGVVLENAVFVELPGRDQSQVNWFVSVLLLILYGRIMKRLTSNGSEPHDAVELSAYFEIYCRLGTDAHLMRRIWGVIRDFVDYAIDAYQ